MKREVEEEEELKEREREVMSLKSKKRGTLTREASQHLVSFFHYLFSSLVLFMVLIQLNETSSRVVVQLHVLFFFL